MSNRDALKHLGNVTPATRAIAGEIADHLTSLGYTLPRYGAPYSGPVMHGYANGSEHGTGRAIDVMVMSPGAMGDAVADFVWKHRATYDLQHVIWKQRIRSTKVSPGVWRGMADRGSGTNNHMDHPHIFLGVNAKPLGSSGGSQPASKPTKTKYYKPTGTSLTVKEIQRIVGVKADSYYGNDTKAAVKKYQKKLGVTADGYWGKLTQAAHDKKGSKPTSKPKPSSSSKAPKFPLPRGHYFGPKSGPASSVSGYYSHRADLKRWQAQMRKRGWSITADGLYGPATAKVARQFQAEKAGLAVDGLIGAKTWAAAWTEPVT